jgi:hypothetical protein
MSQADDLTEVIEVPEGEPLEAEVTTAEEPSEVDALKLELEAERKKAADAEARYRAAAGERDNHQARLSESVSAQFASHDALIDARINAADFNLRSAKAEYATAQAEGRFAEAADLAEKIADAKHAAREAANEKARLAQMKQQAEAEATRAPAVTDPVDRMLAGVQSDASRNWLRSNRAVAEQMATDQRYFAKVAAADNEAYSSGIDRDTPEYFAFIEQKLGLKDAPVTEAAPAARPRSSAAASAAPARRAPAGASEAGRTVHIDDVVRRLTPEMRAAAKTSFPNATQEDALKTYALGIVKSKQRDPSYLPNFKL